MCKKFSKNPRAKYHRREILLRLYATQLLRKKSFEDSKHSFSMIGTLKINVEFNIKAGQFGVLMKNVGLYSKREAFDDTNMSRVMDCIESFSLTHIPINYFF